MWFWPILIMCSQEATDGNEETAKDVAGEGEFVCWEKKCDVAPKNESLCYFRVCA